MNPQLVKELQSEKDDLVKQLKGLEQIILREKDLRNRIAAIEALLYFYNEENKLNIQSPNNELRNQLLFESPSEEYDKNLTWEGKCLFALKELKTAYTSDIAERIFALEPTLNKKRVKEAAAFYLSKLLKERKIMKVGQSGRKYKFSLLNEK